MSSTRKLWLGQAALLLASIKEPRWPSSLRQALGTWPQLAQLAQLAQVTPR